MVEDGRSKFLKTEGELANNVESINSHFKSLHVFDEKTLNDFVVNFFVENIL